MFASLDPSNRLAREIENHYHLQLVAANATQIVEYQERAFRQQREAAAANLRALAGQASRQDTTNRILDGLAAGLDQLNSTAGGLLAATEDQTEVLRGGFYEIAQLLLKQKHTLQQIAKTLRRPYETQALELLKEADRALKNGSRSAGRDQQEDFRDAMRLFSEVLKNPIGSRNYVAWFQVGWLKWKHKQNLPEAADAFYQAGRLSHSEENYYHPYSLWHLANVQYLQGQYEDAYATIQGALAAASDDHGVLYDAARYAAVTRRDQEAVALLEKCIDMRPQTIVTMLSERDFLS